MQITCTQLKILLYFVPFFVENLYNSLTWFRFIKPSMDDSQSTSRYYYILYNFLLRIELTFKVKTVTVNYIRFQ